MLKLADVERELGVSRWTLYEWLKEGKLQGMKLPSGHYRVLREEIENLKKASTKYPYSCHTGDR
ncbi:helix-turn-helix domain-containing protein [Chloroflexota bacterium]